MNMYPTVDLLQETRIIYTISELNLSVKGLLEDSFPSLWVEGEISNFSCPASGHWYFSLKDAKAQIRCAMFQGRNRIVGFQPKNGMHLLARARMSLYEARGEYQLLVDYLELAGEGALRQAFEQLKKELQKEGLFESQYKKNIPLLPRSIGIVTSPTGAALRDILAVLKRRFPAIPIIIYPSAVQGKNAAGQLVEMLQLANYRQECDVLILTRGGGSLEDLWPFNEELLARAVFASKIPIISAIGHEIDFTIADFVADIRAPTPSVAAELASPDQEIFKRNVVQLSHRLRSLCNRSLESAHKKLENLQNRLRHPGQHIHEQKIKLNERKNRLIQAIQIHMLQKRQELSAISRTLDTISPLATLARGYSLTFSFDNVLIRNAKAVHLGDKIKTRLASGDIISQVIEKK